MVSEVQICNRALIMIHADTITALSDESPEGVACNVLYPQVRDEVLRAHFWNFAVAQKNLQQDSDTPLFDFNYQYTLPADYIRIYRLENDSYRYKVKGRKIHTDASGVKIEYIKRETDTTLYDPLFVACVATRLASLMAYPIAGSESRAATLLEEYKDLLKEAKRRDGQEGTPDDLTADLFVDSRYQDTGYSNDWTKY